MTLGLTAQEAFHNLYVLFAPKSLASLYYHKHGLPRAWNLEQVLSLMCSRFSYSERRDRLIRQWNIFHFSQFKNKPNTTLHTAASTCAKQHSHSRTSLDRPLRTISIYEM